jgi:hypothetical protein
MRREIFPKVTAVMCTGLPGRTALALAAVRSFYAQNHPHREMLIYNHSKDQEHEFRLTEHLPQPPDGVVLREILVDPFPTLGDMRSSALDRVTPDTKYVVQWDDDDWSHPTRITRQLNALQAAQTPGACCTLGCQVRYSVPKNTAFRHVNRKEGIAGTIMHPHDGNRYQAEHGTEDSTFLKEHYLPEGKCVVLCDTDMPELYLRFFHKGNLCSERHVMKVYARPQWRGNWIAEPEEGGYLPPASRSYLAMILTSEYERHDLNLAAFSCEKCKRQYTGELKFVRGDRNKPKAPFRWKKVWRNPEPGDYYLARCYRC